MRTDGHDLVIAARAGDQRAMDALVAEYLPLVYNVVGRALDGHADVDDVVQETMVRAVRGLPRLRRPEDFRSWLVAIAMRQITDRGRARQRVLARSRTLEESEEVADPGGDFADLTVLRLELTGQRRETAEATRWLDQDDRRLLSLWWLEAMGELTRGELASALRLSNAHAAVRVQRVKERLSAARAVVRALDGRPLCADLAPLADRWDGRPGPLWRKRFSRHIRECASCGNAFTGQVPTERLLASFSLVPVPLALLARPDLLAGAAAAAHRSLGLQAVGGTVAAKPLAAGMATVVAAAVAAVAVTVSVPREDPQPLAPTVVTATESDVSAAPAPSADPGPEADTGRDAAPAGEAAGGPAPAEEDAVEGEGVYGSVVSGPGDLPPNVRPGELPRRPESGVRVVDGMRADPGGNHVMPHRGEYVTLSGQGYVRVRYQIGRDRTGEMIMPTWTGLDGRLFHVASGGGRRMDDTLPGHEAGSTWMGDPERGYVVLPDGARQMWQSEFFYLDGTVTFTNHERGADYNLVVRPLDWWRVDEDVNAEPGSQDGILRYGVVHDTGDDTCPVPQYLTREATADPARVPQRSEV
ncbi:RNA polymerase sigma factor [Nocardiopsis sp. NPDC050513]|uniref:RNA polymerase sigma factor n=1 Tax=Nocardiopsis sp. NPDC050513 TaxID=3364338 RepID=UPI003793FF23